jgi:hypothetical protein
MIYDITAVSDWGPNLHTLVESHCNIVVLVVLVGLPKWLEQPSCQWDMKNYYSILLVHCQGHLSVVVVIGLGSVLFVGGVTHHPH